MGKVLTYLRRGEQYTQVDPEKGIDEGKYQTENITELNQLGTAFVQQFNKTIAIIPPTQESLAQFDQLLEDDQLKRLEDLIEEKKFEEAPNTIPELKSVLCLENLQTVLITMLKDTEKYQDYLEQFIVRFQAENELPRPKHIPESESKPTKKLSAPIHYAVLQLNEKFLDFLLKRPNIDVNLRDSFKRTALTLLCANYDQCMKSKKPCPIRLAKNRTLIKQLLKAGADFNICSKHMKLPFELLLKHCEHDETRSFVEECVQLARVALAVCRINERKECVVGFYNNNPDVQVTVELLEIFLRRNDCTKFKEHIKDFKVNETNVKKVIRLLLHTACDQSLADCVRLVLDRGGQHIFKVVQPSFTQDKTNIKIKRTAPSSNSMVANTVQSEQPTYGTGSAVKVPNDQTSEQNIPSSRSSAVEELQSSEQECTKEKKGYELEHRVELKGLLKKVCLMADLSLLQHFLAKISDPILLNDDPLLVHTLRKANFSNCIEERNQLIACAEYLATQETIHMSKKDNSGNTSLHLAIKYGFDSVARLLLRQQYSDLGMRNKANQTPLDYGTYEFWKNYFDSCIEVDWKRSISDREEIRFNINGLCSPLLMKGVDNPVVNTDGNDSSSSWKKLLQKAKTFINPETPTNAVTEMMILQQIAQSKELKRLLIHPVINTFITVKWIQLCQWNCLNLLLTALTIVFFGHYSLTACSAAGPSTLLMGLSFLGVGFVVIRELIEVLFLGRSYLSWENLHDITIVISMITVLRIGCSGLVSSFVIISLAIQFTFLLASVHPTKFATIMYMFKTVSINFLKSFGFFSPLILSFIYAFHLTYNQSPEDQEQVCKGNECTEGKFSKFTTFWNATVKTLVMTTGELDAASLDLEDGKMLLFLAFVFVAPIVILNLINGLAVNDIAAIQEESELISISKKVMLLEQYERGVANMHSAWLKRCFPKPFCSVYQSRIHVKTKEHRKIVVHLKAKPKEQCNSSQRSKMQDDSNSRQQRSSQRVDSNKQNGQKTSNKKAQNRKLNTKELENPIARFPWLFTWDSWNFISEIRILREALFMYLNVSIVDEALAIIEKQNGHDSLVTLSSTASTEVPVTPLSDRVAFSDQQHQPGSSKNHQNSKQSIQDKDDVLRELTTLMEQLKARETEIQEQLKTGLVLQERLKTVLGEFVKRIEFQDLHEGT